jgi:hypothetical protein
MARSIIAVIASYVAMFVLTFVGFTCLYLLIGPGHAFKPGSYMASNRWIAMAFGIYFVIAVIGGFLCALIARGGKAPLALAIVVLALGLLLAIPSVIAHRTNPNEVRVGAVSNLEAMQKAKEPLWVPFTFPIIGVVGVLVGSRLRRKP